MNVGLGRGPIQHGENWSSMRKRFEVPEAMLLCYRSAQEKSRMKRDTTHADIFTVHNVYVRRVATPAPRRGRVRAGARPSGVPECADGRLLSSDADHICQDHASILPSARS